MQTSSTSSIGCDATTACPSEDADSSDWKIWRKAERTRLIDLRLSFRREDLKQRADVISATLLSEIAGRSNLIVSAYWPIRGEPELRPLMRELQSSGHRTALPVVVERNAAMVFREWKSGDRLERGIWKIPVPADGQEVMPDIIIAPVVGFDDQCFRLGYGGGYFDRTLASLPRRPRVIGVGYSCAKMPTIHPKPHDIPMSCIVTEDGIVSG